MWKRVIISVLAVWIAGCSQEAAPSDSTPDAPAYAAPPTAERVEQKGGGMVAVSGRAGPDERVRMIRLDGVAHGVTADGTGAFEIPATLGQGIEPLFNLSVERAGQSVSSDGWLYVPVAAPERAVMLRVGGASLPVGAAPLLAVVDMDGGGGVALSGRAEPDAEVRISIDGSARGTARAGPDGIWFSVLALALAPGNHQISVTAGNQRDQRQLALAGVRAEGAVEAVQVDGAIRVAWALPGGGSQTTWILL